MPHGSAWDQFGWSLVEHVRGHPVDHGAIAGGGVGAADGQEIVRPAVDFEIHYADHLRAMDAEEYIRELHHGREGVVLIQEGLLIRDVDLLHEGKVRQAA